MFNRPRDRMIYNVGKHIPCGTGVLFVRFIQREEDTVRYSGFWILALHFYNANVTTQYTLVRVFLVHRLYVSVYIVSFACANINVKLFYIIETLSIWKCLYTSVTSSAYNTVQTIKRQRRFFRSVIVACTLTNGVTWML